MTPLRINLEQEDIPTHWYNVVADMPNAPLPPLGPDGNPATPEQMSAIFPMAILEQEMSAERWIPIPQEVREVYRLWRPSPLVRAIRLEQMLGTPAKIYYKNEGVSPAGSHKPNTAVAQAYYNKQAGIKRITTETGAGQWGCSMALAGQMFGLEVRVYMVKISYGQKPYRRSMMQTWGAQVFASPSNMTETGRNALAADPNKPVRCCLHAIHPLLSCPPHRRTVEKKKRPPRQFRGGRLTQQIPIATASVRPTPERRPSPPAACRGPSRRPAPCPADHRLYRRPAERSCPPARQL